METITLTIDENNRSAVALIEFLKTLDFVEIIEVRYDDEKKAAAEELISIMLERANLEKEDIHDRALKIWISKNLDLLTEEEYEKYKKIGILI